MRPPVLCCLLLLSLCGCSSTRLAYNNADWLLKREVVKYTCPTDAQEQRLEQELRKLHAWHRQQELPRYAGALRDLAAGIGDAGQREPALRRFFAQLTTAGRRFSAYIAGPSARYLSRLGVTQRKCLIKRLRERNDELLEEVRLPRARYIAEQRAKLDKTLGRFIGELTAAQRGILDELIGRRQKRHLEILSVYRSWGPRMRSVLKGKRPATRAAAAIKDRFTLYSEAERKLLLRWEEQGRDLTRIVARLLTAEQQARLRQNLLALAGDLEALSKE